MTFLFDPFLLVRRKVDTMKYAFEIRIPKNDEDIEAVGAGPRDIYLYTGDIDLNQYHYRVVEI